MVKNYMKQNILNIENISFAYNKDNVLNNINLTIENNSVFGIIGQNGSGKTTLLKILLSILKHQQGQIKFYDKYKIGVVLEFLGMFPNLTAERNLKISATIKQVSFDEIDMVLKKTGLLEHKNKKTKTFSLGMKQRLSIAACLLGNPDIVILDEPTNGLDPLAIIELRNIINQIAAEGKTIIIASHILSELEKICTHIAVINKGKITLSGELPELMKNYKNIEELFIKNLV